MKHVTAGCTSIVFIRALMLWNLCDRELKISLFVVLRKTAEGSVSLKLLKGQCYEMDIFLCLLLSVLSVYALMVFKVFQKLFTILYNY
jgi:hypothetical protein